MNDAMGIETVRNAVLADAQKETEQMIRAAEQEAAQLLRQEREQLANARKALEEELGQTLESNRKERLAWAQLEAQRQLAEAREDAIKAALERVYEELGRMRKSTTYTKFLQDALRQAAKELGNDIIAHVRREDKGRLKAEEKMTVKTDGEEAGLWTETPDGRIRFNATLSQRMERMQESLRKEIHQQLFPQSEVKAKRAKKHGKTIRA